MIDTIGAFQTDCSRPSKQIRFAAALDRFRAKIESAMDWVGRIKAGDDQLRWSIFIPLFRVLVRSPAGVAHALWSAADEPAGTRFFRDRSSGCPMLRSQSAGASSGGVDRDRIER